jgi:hypothetical protein
LSTTWLTSNCDVIFSAFGEDRFLRKFLIRYDLKKDKISIPKFLFSLKTIFADLLPPEIADCLDVEFGHYDTDNCVEFKTLAKILQKILRTGIHYEEKQKYNFNVAMLSPRKAVCGCYDIYICSFTEPQNFDQFKEYILNKKKCIISCVAKNYGDVPVSLSQMFFCTTGNVLTMNDFKNFRSKGNYAKFDEEISTSVAQTKIAYDARRNVNTAFDEYSYIMDVKNDSCVACKTVEVLLKNPAIAFYDHVLKLENVNSSMDMEIGRKIFLGSFIHELLNISKRCQVIPILEQFYSKIDWKIQLTWKEIMSAYSAAEISVDYTIFESFSFAKYVAYKFAEKIVSLGFKFMKTEVDIPICVVLIDEFVELKLAGRIDCVLSDDNFDANRSADVSIYDFKTGNHEMLNSEKISSQLSEYIGVQLYMYGLIYKRLGYENVKVQILRHDCQIFPAIDMNLFFSESNRIFSKLSTIIRTGVLGEKEIKFGSGLANLPIATITLPGEIIKQKLLKQ